MFSMFFGAGNVVFPLALGQTALNQNTFAILGFLLTAVGVPFLGLIAMTLFDGNYKNFFGRLGEWPSAIVVCVIMGLIGPLGALPRCIALSYSILSHVFPSISIQLFSFISCLIIFAFTYRPNNIVDILGKVLTPLLLLALGVIIFKGVLQEGSPSITSRTPSEVFMNGMKSGYQTMDLLGSFFFSSVVILCLKESKNTGEFSKKWNDKELIYVALKAACIGAFLLSLVYVGFSYVAAKHSSLIQGVPTESLLGSISEQILGKSAAIVAAIAVGLACLTTAIALAVVFAEYLHLDLSEKKLSYPYALILTLVLTFCISTLNFTGIVRLLAPILEIFYPALIILCALNIGYKLYHFRPVKIPVYAVFIATLFYQIWSWSTIQ